MGAESGERIRVLIIDDIPETRENLRKLLSFDPAIQVVGAAGSGREGIELVKQLRPHVVLMDINMPDMDGITATEMVLQAVPTVQVVMLSVQSETDYMRRAMLAGARDFLTKPPSLDELMHTIHRVYETGKLRSAAIAPAQPAVPIMSPSDGRGARRPGEVVAVFSPKGGVGCTTIAVNLAVAMKQMEGGALRVALVDAHLQFGDVGVMLNLQPTRSIVDLVGESRDLDSDMLNSVLTAHGSGIRVLLAPPNPEEAERLIAGERMGEDATGTAILRTALGLLREEFDITLVDMWSWLDDIALTVFDAASLIILVITPDIPAIKSARQFVEVASRMNYPTEKIALVVNQMDPSSRITIGQIEAAMLPVAAQIPLDARAAINAANQGVPFVMRDRNRPISQAIYRLAERVRKMLLQAQEAGAQGEQGRPAAVPASRTRFGRAVGQT